MTDGRAAGFGQLMNTILIKSYMKKLVSFALLLCLVMACQPKKETTETTAETPTPAEEATPVLAVKRDARKIGPEKSPEQILIEEAIEKLGANTAEPAVGYWVGMFGKNKINIAIAEVKEGKALGYTVCAGNYRPITGTATDSDGSYKFIMNEPGTDKYDGHFEFTIDTTKPLLTGTWAPFQKGIVGEKTYELEKATYAYQPGLGQYPQASSRLLEESDVSNLLAEELEYMRNEIYARHGYSFKDLEDRRQFDTVSWYIPMGIDIREKLTDIEVQNIDLIYEYESYAEENYDSYGR